MESIFQSMRAVRAKIAAQLEGLSTGQLNAIPAGLNNNLVWQLGHLVVSTELLAYVRSQSIPHKEVPLADRYKIGTKPEGPVSAEEIDWLKERFFTSINQLEADFLAGKLVGAQPFSTHTFGITANTIEEVFHMCLWHDTLHWGNITVMRKLVQEL